MRTAEGKTRLFVAIDRTSKFAYVEFYKKAGKMIAAQFLRDLIAALPYKIHTILPPSRDIWRCQIPCRSMDNGIQFTKRKQDTSAFEHIFDRVCRENGIKHRLTKVNHPWSSEDQEKVRGTFSPRDGQVDRPPLGRFGVAKSPAGPWNRTIKEGEAQSRSGGSAVAERQAVPL